MFQKKVLRPIASVVMIAFGALCVQPAVSALLNPSPKITTGIVSDNRGDALAGLLTKMHQYVDSAVRKMNAQESASFEVERIVAIARELPDAERGADDYLRQSILGRKSLSPEQADRGQRLLNEFSKRQESLHQGLERLTQAQDARSGRKQAILELHSWFGAQSARKQIDPSNLPWRTVKKSVRAPASHSAAAQKVLRAKALAGPSADDLAESEDVQLTDQIRAKAAELGNAVAMLNFVQRNIEFSPSYGSIQGSDSTLSKRRGNAFDTSSLLIALLRAANIPARYVYGTIEVPVSQAMNWVGGVSNADALFNVLGQGGIPARPVISGGAITAVQMDHVWVEAWLPMFPSRGAKPSNQPAGWLPLDASFKQYAFKQAMNLSAAVPFDVTGFQNAAMQGATVNDQEGWAQNLNYANATSYSNSYRDALNAFLNGGATAPTVHQVLGNQTALADNLPILPGTLKTKIVVQGPRYSQLPDSLRHHFRYSLYSSSEDRALDNPTLSVDISVPRVSGKTLTLSFVPASDSDADALMNAMPSPHADGTPIQANEWPSTLPATIHVTAEVRLDGQTIASGGAFPLGTELAGLGGFTNYDFSGWDLSTDDTLVAGQPTAIGISAEGIDPIALQKLASKLSNTENLMSSGQFSGLDGEDIARDGLSAVAMTYFAGVDAFGSIAKTNGGMIDLPALSYGLIHAKMNPVNLFGTVTTGVRAAGVMADIGHFRNRRVAKNNDPATWVAYNRFRGQEASAMEGAYLTQFFDDPATQQPTTSVSAVQAIATAAQSGQRIYRINKANVGVISALQIDPDTVSEISSAVQAGLEVQVHSAPVQVGHWSGVGYIVIDPATGAGSYLIAGAANGGAAEADTLLLGASSLLGGTDQRLKTFLDQRYIFSNLGKYLAQLSKMSQMAGIAGLLASEWNVFTSDVSVDKKIGQASVNLLTYVIVGFLIVTLLPASGIGVLGIAAAMAIAAIFSMAATLINDIYFSLIFPRRLRSVFA